MQILNYKLEIYEGPLDLLLNLIQKNKMNIEDIQISVLCDQYTEYISAAKELDIELSSDFLVMASELMLIKSKMLLPHNSDDEEDPRAALAAAVLEYKRAKEVAVILKEMFGEYGTRMIKDTDEIAPDKTYVCDHDVELLAAAMKKVMSEVRVTDEEAKEKFKPLIAKKVVSVSYAAEKLARRLKKDKKVTLSSYFVSAESVSELVSMFLALLELLKSGALLLEQEPDSEGVIDAAGDTAVVLEPGTDVSELTKIIGDE